jgi:hypothetical protein
MPSADEGLRYDLAGNNKHQWGEVQMPINPFPPLLKDKVTLVKKTERFFERISLPQSNPN